MSTAWKNSCRIKARKLFKEAGISESVKISNKEGGLGEQEIAWVYGTKYGGGYIPFTLIEKAFSNSWFRVENINDEMAILKLRKKDEP